MRFFEIEQKYRIKNARPVRVLLKKIGAKKIVGGPESNEFFDRQGSLRRKKIALRLRRFGRETTLTLKGPKVRAHFTKRMEIESPVDYGTFKTILHRAGFQVVRSYRKKREIYKLGQVIVALDFLKKFGWFLEIEGPSRWIARLEKQLGLTCADREKKSYLQMMFGDFDSH